MLFESEPIQIIYSLKLVTIQTELIKFTKIQINLIKF